MSRSGRRTWPGERLGAPRVRFLILAHLGDQGAERVYDALRERQGAAARLVLAEQLVLAPKWSHHLADAGASSVVWLADGTCLASAAIGVVFNRLHRVRAPHFARAALEDQEYAVMELTALLLSWLASLPCPVINPPSPRGLGGAERGLAEWLWLGARAGLPTPALRLTSNGRRFAQSGQVRHEVAYEPGGTWPRPEPAGPGAAWERPALFLEPGGAVCERLLVAGQTALGPGAARWGEASLKLAERSGTPLLELGFGGVKSTEHDRGLGLVLRSINPFPTLDMPEAVGAVVELLEAAAAGAPARVG